MKYCLVHIDSVTDEMERTALNFSEKIIGAYRLFKVKGYPIAFAGHKKCTKKEIDLLIAKLNAGAPRVENISVDSTKTVTAAFSEKQTPDGRSLFKRVHGSDIISIAPGETESIQIEIGYAWAKIEAMEIIGAGAKHTLDLLILDSDTNTYSGLDVGTYGANFTLNQFAFDTVVRKDYHRFSSKYDADLFLGMVVEILITNDSLTASDVGLNIELNEVRTT